MDIVIYGKKGDAHTVAFKNFLRMAEIEFTYKNLAEDEAARTHTKELYEGAMKYPTLIVDDEVYLTPTSDTFNKVMKDLKLRG